MKNQFKLKHIEQNTLKVGDIVNVFDGSSITSEKHNGSIFIVNEYPELTGLSDPLKDIDAEVMKVGIEDLFCFGVPGFKNQPSIIYRQDIQIRIGKGIFYTNSAMVSLIKTL